MSQSVTLLVIDLYENETTNYMCSAGQRFASQR